MAFQCILLVRIGELLIEPEFLFPHLRNEIAAFLGHILNSFTLNLLCDEELKGLSNDTLLMRIGERNPSFFFHIYAICFSWSHT